MDAKRFAIGSLVGGVTVFVAGTLIFAMSPFRSFMAYAMSAGSATGVAREPQILWAVALGAYRTARSSGSFSGSQRTSCSMASVTWEM